MRFSKLVDDAIWPSRGTTKSAGYDLFSRDHARIYSGERLLIPTGITIKGMPDSMCGIIMPRSGKALKEGLMIMGGLIDADYEGDIGVILFNSSKYPVDIDGGSAIAQIVLQHYGKVDNDLVINDLRTGGFGHTGN